ncbi:multidrug efflux SMR transporter [Lactobacillus sp. LL6]|uniref:DMT family transporter n=1 Tax=Lactobacillus sp. LL6 TaxID=2596827 RepID=UPI001184F7D6|nr:multidrug efflux SMR transporter [Lactobacillus sp. LL6]TSO26722.1 multidrug efflux SMR transporter [Lactobacillus sp. LL6]
MHWIYLIIAGLLETVWASTMKLSDGFSNLPYSIATIIGMIFSFGALALATKDMSLSIAYPIWTGIGAVGTVIAGVIIFKENLNWMTLVFVGLLIISIIGIKFTSGE